MASVEQRVDTVLSEFDAWFQGLGNDPLVRSERAALKTFCWYLLNVRTRSFLPSEEARKEEPAPTAPAPPAQ